MSIGIVGKQGSGKSTIAAYIAEHYDYTIDSLAAPLRSIAREFFGVTKQSPDYRTIMQTIGTDWFRSVDQNVWIRHLMARAKGRVVVDDVRFVNEAEAMLVAGWRLLFLHCPSPYRMQRRDVYVGDTHVSEQGVDDILSQFHNRITIIDTARPLDEVLSDVRWWME